MTAMLFLIPMALVLLAVAVAIFIWSLKRGQYEDMQGPAHRIIIEDREERARLERRDDESREAASTDKQDPPGSA